MRALASRIGILCRGAAIIYDFEGTVIASTGEAPTQLIWNEVAATNLRELLLDTSERLLGALYGIQHGATLRDRRDNEQLLASLHDGILASREHRFWAPQHRSRLWPKCPGRYARPKQHSPSDPAGLRWSHH